mmetsp:Transcript_17814/g.58620  ORF Transcript_17814/g.58620 Transcript_17814/m.58620 type:complete len:206 (-) Transcript_17814:438-1055(-)
MRQTRLHFVRQGLQRHWLRVRQSLGVDQANMSITAAAAGNLAATAGNLASRRPRRTTATVASAVATHLRHGLARAGRLWCHTVHGRGLDRLAKCRHQLLPREPCMHQGAVGLGWQHLPERPKEWGAGHRAERRQLELPIQGMLPEHFEHLGIERKNDMPRQRLLLRVQRPHGLRQLGMLQVPKRVSPLRTRPGLLLLVLPQRQEM